MAINGPIHASNGISDLPYHLPEHFSLGRCDGLTIGSAPNIPSGFPTQVDVKSTWTAAQLEGHENDFITHLSSAETSAIEQSLQRFKDSKTELRYITSDNFPLPAELSEKLDQISETCYNGLGFCILRGLGGTKRSDEDMAILFAGVSAHVASNRGFQDEDRKHVLAHLFKRYPQYRTEYIPPSFNDSPVEFHTDDGDIVALYYPSITTQGGKTLLASASQIYNELAIQRPDLIHELAQEWVTERANPNAPPRRLPLLFRHNDGITIQFSRLPFSRYEGSRTANPNSPQLSPRQKEALNALQILAEKHALPVPAQSGDILFFSNITLFHARQRYVEPGTSEMAPELFSRLVLRLWLQDPARTKLLPPGLQEIWDMIYGPNASNGRDEHWNVKIIASYNMNVNKNG